MLRIECHCTSLPSTWPKVSSKISLHKVTMLMFSQELIWSGEICFTNIVVSGFILKMRSEVNTLLEKWCISLPFHSVTLAIKADTRQPSISFIIEDHPWLSLYGNWLRSTLYCCLLTFEKLSMLIGSEVYSILTYFRKTNLMAIVTTGAFAVVTKK